MFEYPLDNFMAVNAFLLIFICVNISLNVVFNKIIIGNNYFVVMGFRIVNNIIIDNNYFVVKGFRIVNNFIIANDYTVVNNIMHFP